MKFQISAKENINVFEAFYTMTKDIINTANIKNNYINTANIKKNESKFKTHLKSRKKSFDKKCPFDNLKKFINY